MKNLFLATLIFFCGVGLYAQNNDVDIKSNDVPTQVKTTFSQNFTKASDVEWEQVGKNYKASFEVNRKDHDVIFSSSGEMIAHQYEINKKEVPSAVLSKVKALKPNGKIDDVSKIEMGGNINYKISVNGKPDLTVWYSEDGTLLKKKMDD